jgi:dihydroorotate dehydrogenase
VQVGTASFYDPRTVLKVLEGLEAFMKRRRFSTLRDLIGRIDL